MAKIVQGLADMGNSMMPGFFPSLSNTVVQHGVARVIDDTPRQVCLLILKFVDHRGDSHRLPFVSPGCRSCNIADPVGFKTPTAINRHSAPLLIEPSRNYGQRFPDNPA